MSPRAQRSQVEMRFLALASRSPVFRQCRKTFGVSETFECRDDHNTSIYSVNMEVKISTYSARQNEDFETKNAQIGPFLWPE
ncbi:unnamed protein product [Nesidiocoris tenuis]|uniref:Uncharacterized protein n=1 Tax=Nesidiocoris tenuis TaxID=355587 RepID=A0A6H5H1L1_9HEMI|nr:unnamed protein product [Nesidiocoris tenuis]